jgi:hypothetical protein
VLDSEENITASCIPLLPAGGSLNSMLLVTTQEDTFKINEVTVGYTGKERDVGKSVALLLTAIYFDAV